MAIVAIGGFWHETNTFNRIVTDRRHFAEAPGVAWDGARLLAACDGEQPVLTGFRDGLVANGLAPEAAFFTMAPPSTGMIAAEAFEWAADRLVSSVVRARADGILLHLHGAAVSALHLDPESELLRRIRAAVGWAIPIVTVNDSHGNVGPDWVRTVDAAIGYKRAPHTDMRDRGREAASLIARMLRGEPRPTRAIARPPILVKGGLMTLTEGQLSHLKPPFVWLAERARELERGDGILNVTVNSGFGDADTETTGLSIVVHADEAERAHDVATELANLAWRLRRGLDLGLVLTGVEAAVRRAVESDDWPVILADEGNNTAGGSPGDGTAILAELGALGWPDAVLFIHDAAAVADCMAAGVGRTLELEVGGKLDVTAGDPIAISATIESLWGGPDEVDNVLRDAGGAAVVRVGSTHVVLTRNAVYQTSPVQFRRFGIDPARKRIVVVQSAHAFRHEFVTVEGLARRIIEVDTPGTTSPNLADFAYRHLQRPVFPLDDRPDMADYRRQITWTFAPIDGTDAGIADSPAGSR